MDILFKHMMLQILAEHGKYKFLDKINFFHFQRKIAMRTQTKIENALLMVPCSTVV